MLRNTQVSLINTNKGSALLKYQVPEAEAAKWNSAIIKDPLQACSEAFRKILQCVSDIVFAEKEGQRRIKILKNAPLSMAESATD